MLGYRAQQVYGYISECERAGYAPSYAEICAEFNLCSKGDVHRIVLSLERRGLVGRDSNRRWGRSGHRVLRVIRPRALSLT